MNSLKIMGSKKEEEVILGMEPIMKTMTLSKKSSNEKPQKTNKGTMNINTTHSNGNPVQNPHNNNGNQ